MSEVMTPTEFVLWLNGATSMLEGPPSAEQWTKMQENLHPIIAKMMAEKLMGTAEEVQATKTHKEQIAQLQKEMSYKHALEIEYIKQQFDPSSPWYSPTKTRNLGTITTATSIAPLNNTWWQSSVPPG